MKLATKRALAATGVLGLVGVGLAVHTGTGTPSAWGIADIAAICPLGAIEAAVASKTIVPPLFVGLAIAVLLVVLVGRAFCAWGCPVPLLRRLFGVKEPRYGKDAQSSKRASGAAREASDATLPAAERGGVNDSRNWVLGATVLTTAAFGFPVFCLICPVGLTVATFIALWRVFQFSEVTLSLVVFPLILLVEVLLLRKWCHRFCPLGALMGLVARLNKTFRPTVNTAVCLRHEGATCSHCAEVCPEGIDFHQAEVSAPLSECTKCGECAVSCPAHAISFPFLPREKSAAAAARREGATSGAVEDEPEALAG